MWNNLFLFQIRQCFLQILLNEDDRNSNEMTSSGNGNEANLQVIA